jgi:hypothetical protein
VVDHQVEFTARKINAHRSRLGRGY